MRGTAAPASTHPMYLIYVCCAINFRPEPVMSAVCCLPAAVLETLMFAYVCQQGFAKPVCVRAAVHKQQLGPWRTAVGSWTRCLACGI